MRAAHQPMTAFILEGISGGVHYADLGEPLEDHVADTMPRNKMWTTTSRRSVVGASRPPRLSGPVRSALLLGAAYPWNTTNSLANGPVDGRFGTKKAPRAFRSNLLVSARRAARRSLPTRDTPGRLDIRPYVNSACVDVSTLCHGSDDMHIPYTN
jgi:hypothetical protein